MPSDYSELIKERVNSRVSVSDIAEEFYLSYPPIGFSEDWSEFHAIRKKVSIAFNVPITSVHVCGSCQLGVSPVKFTPFEKGKSDLDLAIVDSLLFTKLLREAKTVTNGFKNLTGFNRRQGQSDHPQFMKNISANGMVRPDLMPRCESKTRWFDTFREISRDYLDIFSKISAGVYLSEFFFFSRQADALEIMKDGL